MKKKRIFKEPTRYSNLFSKVLPINLAIHVMLNQRHSAAAEQMHPSEELHSKSHWSLMNALRNHSNKQGGGYTKLDNLPKHPGNDACPRRNSA